MKEMWDKRYGSEEFAYGVEPNEYFKEKIGGLKPGKILLPAEGEGRNAVYAAELGWNVQAFDLSTEGKAKAERLARLNQVKIDYQVAELSEIKLKEEAFDVVALIYAHFPPHMKSAYHKQLDKYVKTGGLVILEGFSKSHPEVSKNNGKPMGPQHPDMLFSEQEIKMDFPNYEIIELKEEQIILNEGEFHEGLGSVVRFVGRKK